MSLYYIEKSNLLEALKELEKSHNVHIQSGYKDDVHYERLDFNKEYENIVGPYRAEEPIRSFFTQAKEVVSGYFGPGTQGPKKKNIIVGAKACDLESFKTQDYVFELTEPVEESYVEKKRNTIVISADCTAFKQVCYCMYLGINPFPEKGFDLNLSPQKNGYVVETGSQKGQELINTLEQYFRQATRDEVLARDAARKEVCDKLRLSIDKMGLPPKDSLYSLVKKGMENATWQKWADKCVECGACTQSCPTCHCFLLYDRPQDGSYAKARIWDSCQFYGFSVVAGGATPRPKIAQRLRNRYVKKFEFFPDVNKNIACTGCGRCIEACIGKIDMREVFRDLAE